MGTHKNRVFIQGSMILIIFIIGTLSACQHPGNSNPTQVTPTIFKEPITPTPTFLPQIPVTINGFPYEFNHYPQIIKNVLWLPAYEVFELLDRPDINRTKDFISTADYDDKGNMINCHFPIGEYSYSIDTINNVWIDTEYPAFISDEEIYLSEKMMEDCIGEFIDFDASTKTINLKINNLTIDLLQSNNTNPISFYKLKDPNELVDSRIGNLVSGCIKNPALDWIDWSQTQKRDGFTRARITLNASDGPAVNFSLVGIESAIPPEYVAIYKTLKELGIKTRYSLSFWDLAFRQSGGTISRNRLNSKGEIDRYLDYVRMVVGSLKGLVSEYELWNEPDANFELYQRIRPEDYIEVARQVIPIIREIDPEVKIVLVSTSNYVEKPVQDYSRIILESDIISMADAISMHTVNNDASPEYLSAYYYGYDEMWKGIKSLAEAHGFSGDYYADELNYRSNYSLSVLQPEQGNYHPYVPEVASKYFARMIVINLGLNINVGTSGLNFYERPIEGKMVRNLAYLMDGLHAVPLTVAVESDSKLIRYYTFEDMNGDQFIIIWNDDKASVDIKDTSATLELENTSALSVIAYNPFLMNIQNLNFENNPTGIVLKDLLIKDYPLIYQFYIK